MNPCPIEPKAKEQRINEADVKVAKVKFNKEKFLISRNSVSSEGEGVNVSKSS